MKIQEVRPGFRAHTVNGEMTRQQLDGAIVLAVVQIKTRLNDRHLGALGTRLGERPDQRTCPVAVAALLEP